MWGCEIWGKEGTVKTFFDGIFVSQKSLEEAGIEYPIKLEYYKTFEVENVEKNFGIEIVKTEYIEGSTKVEAKEVKNITGDEKKENEILNLLIKNEVTPIGVEDVLEDLLIQEQYIEKQKCKI